MRKKKPGDLVEELDEMTDLDRKVFFEQAGLMCNTWNYTRATIIELMFPSRTNRKHEANLDLCRNFVRNHGYLTRIHVLPDMPASTFRQCILKPLLEDGTVHDRVLNGSEMVRASPTKYIEIRLDATKN